MILSILAPNTLRKAVFVHTRTFVAIATLLCLSGCPDRPTNRGTDVPAQAGDRFEGTANDSSGKNSGSSDTSRTSKDAGRDSTANAEEKPAASTDKR